jgi:hypothetical protein
MLNRNLRLETDNMARLKPGDVVRHKDGGPEMTVVRVPDFEAVVSANFWRPAA